MSDANLTSRPPQIRWRRQYIIVTLTSSTRPIKLCLSFQLMYALTLNESNATAFELVPRCSSLQGLDRRRLLAGRVRRSQLCLRRLSARPTPSEAFGPSGRLGARSPSVPMAFAISPVDKPRLPEDIRFKQSARQSADCKAFIWLIPGFGLLETC